MSASFSLLDGPNRLPKKGKALQSLVILLHGYGSDGHDMIGLADMFKISFPNTGFFAPNAPHHCAINPMGFEWFELPPMDFKTPIDGIRLMGSHITNYIDILADQYKVAHHKILLAGFSQGCMLTLQAGLNHHTQLAGLLGFSGKLLDPDILKAPNLPKPPICLIHGEADTVVPVNNTIEAAKQLKAHGFDVQHTIEPWIGHTISPAGLHTAQDFIKSCLGD